MKTQNVVCVQCGKKYTVELNGAKPYGRSKPYVCAICNEPPKTTEELSPEFGYGKDY